MSTCIIVFAKNPMPNHVKTRLVPTLSPEQAAALYRAFLTDWCETLAELSNVDRVIAYTPPGSQSDLQVLIGKEAIYIPQMGDALGARLVSATQWAIKQEYAKILLVGSDSPTLPISYISQARVMLDSRDIVIGPSVDGGYYLIGLRCGTCANRSAAKVAATVPAIFEEIAWSTAQVFQQTVARVRSAKATLGLLPPWYDVDTAEDLVFLHTHISAMRLAGDTVQAVRTESLLAECFS